MQRTICIRKLLVHLDTLADCILVSRTKILQSFFPRKIISKKRPNVPQLFTGRIHGKIYPSLCKKGYLGIQQFGRRRIEELYYSGKKKGEIPQVGTKLEMHLEIKYSIVLFFQESRHIRVLMRQMFRQRKQIEMSSVSCKEESQRLG